jgi:hypothetical protein
MAATHDGAHHGLANCWNCCRLCVLLQFSHPVSPGQCAFVPLENCVQPVQPAHCNGSIVAAFFRGLSCREITVASA